MNKQNFEFCPLFNRASAPQGPLPKGVPFDIFQNNLGFCEALKIPFYSISFYQYLEFFLVALGPPWGSLGPPWGPKSSGAPSTFNPLSPGLLVLNETIYSNEIMESSMGWIHDHCPIGNVWSFPLPPRALWVCHGLLRVSGESVYAIIFGFFDTWVQR